MFFNYWECCLFYIGIYHHLAIEKIGGILYNNSISLLEGNVWDEYCGRKNAGL